MYNSDIPTRAELPSSRQLLRSTVIAIVAAGAILVTIVLPAEYAIDPTGAGRVLGLTSMGEIKTQLAEEAENDRNGSSQPVAPAVPESHLMKRLFEELLVTPAYAQEMRTDEISVTLAPGEGAEVKLAMEAGAKASFSWSAGDGQVNYDLHGDGGGQNISYEKGRGVANHEGTLEAAFTGNHGWFWRNRTDSPVTVTLRTNGAYSDVKRMM